MSDRHDRLGRLVVMALQVREGKLTKDEFASAANEYLDQLEADLRTAGNDEATISEVMGRHTRPTA